ncbi:MAG: hypothetical protein IKR92_01860 [Alphaproteobacteria bacterium]|nr:hypothetical protein [Alphaproteobacteria bacterium]
MTQKLFTKCGLLQLTDGNKSRLFKVPENVSVKSSEFAEPFEIEVLPFLPEPQAILEVYPDANLIVTQDSIMTLDGQIIMQNEKDKISVIPIKDSAEWIILQDSMHDNDTRFRLTFWDGKAQRDYIWGRYLLQSAKYLALFTSCDHRWSVYTRDGMLVLETITTSEEMRIHGDFLVVEGIGTHSAYALKPDAETAGLCVFTNQQLILCSNEQNFAICANLQGMVSSYYDGFRRFHGQAEMIELYDRAGLYALKRGGRFFLYRFNGERFADNMYPCGADSVAYNQEENTLLIGVNGLFRLHLC